MNANNQRILIAGILATTLAGCAPVVVGGATVVGGAMTREKGLSGSIADTRISTEIKAKLYQKDPDLHARVGVNVQGGEVLLTGALPTNQMHLDAVKIAWEPEGVTRVIDNIALSEGATIGLYAKDTWITTRIKSALLFDQNVHSLNYSIKTVSGIVYLMGIAVNKKEHKHVVDVARNIDGVRKVTSYVKVKGS